MSYALNAIIEKRNIRLLACDSRDVVDEARKLHDLFPTSLAALGRVISIASLMGIMLKGEDEKIQVQINGGGPIGNVFCEAKSNGDIRGFVDDNSIYMKYNDSNKLAVGLAVGHDGYLKVTRFNSEGAPFTSNVALKTGEIGEDFAYYFALSEQVPSLVLVGVLVDTDYSTLASGALIAQLLPGHTEDDIVYLENIQKELKPISSLLNEGLKIEDIINKYFDDVEILERRELKYHCDCSKERFLRALCTLNAKDFNDLLEDEKLEIKCDFCSRVYNITKEELLEYKSCLK